MWARVPAMWATPPHAKPGTLLQNGKTNEVSACRDALGFTLGREHSESCTSHCQRTTTLAAFLSHRNVVDRPRVALPQGAVSS